MKNSKKPNNKPILDNSLIENEDQKNEWLVNENKININQKDINLNSPENSENSEYIKVITASLELNQIEFPRLFELNEDAISDILKKMLTIGYNTYFPKNDLNNDSKLIYENIPQLSTKFDILDTLINKLTGISNNSKKIGIFGENYIQELIAKNFIGVSYQKTGEIDHSGDGLLTLSNGSEILIEIKNYSNIVNDDEIDKFTFDMKTTKRKYGLFLSLNSKINKSKILDLKTFTHDNETYYQFFVSNLSDDLHRLEVGILLLQVLSEHKNSKSKEYILDDTIKEKLTILIDHINENEKLRGCFLDTEKDIRNSLNNFYQKLRDNHMDIENKIKSIFTTLKDNNITNLPSESEENQLLIKYKNTKIINILKKTIDYLDTNSIEYTFNDKEITIKEYGLIKILKEKIVLHTKSKLVIPINIDNWQLFENQFNL
jgi:hypothetical protein